MEQMSQPIPVELKGEIGTPVIEIEEEKLAVTTDGRLVRVKEIQGEDVWVIDEHTDPDTRIGMKRVNLKPLMPAEKGEQDA